MPKDVPVQGDMILMMEALSNWESPLIKTWTRKDLQLSHARHKTLNGWQDDSSFGEKLQPFRHHKDEAVMIRVLHDAHRGINGLC